LLALLRTNCGRIGRLALLVATLALAGAFVTACGGSDDQSTGTAGGSATETAATTGDADLTGTVHWSMLDYDPKVKAWANGVIKAFEAQNPGVKVELTLPPTNSYQQLLTTQLRGKNPPDLAAVPTAWVPAFAEAGALTPWTDVADASLLDRFDPTLLDGAKIDGEQYALPYLSTSRALFWNKTIFEKAGLSEPPATWDELIEDAQTIVDNGAAKYGFALQGTGVEAFAAWFPYVYWSYGGELAGSDGKLAIDRDACVKGVTVLQKMTSQKGVTQPDVTAADLPDQLGLFTSGDAGMTITGPWLVPQLAADAPDLDYGVAPLPEGTASTTLDVQDAFILFKDGKNPDAAAAFAKYLYEATNADELVEGRGMLPVLTEGFDAPRYQDEPLKTFVDLVKTGKFVPSDPGWLKLTDAGGRALQSMYTDGTSPDDTCDSIIEAAQS
jgi:multiple sugar transport system substrate-binding protein